MTAPDVPPSLDVQQQPLIDFCLGWTYLTMFTPEWFCCRDSLADFGVDFSDTETVMAVIAVGTASRLHHPAPRLALAVLNKAVGV